MKRIRAGSVLVVLLMAGPTIDAAALAQTPPTRITILTDAFSRRADLKPDWGFSALIEHQGLRILFDTGNDAVLFRHNVETLDVDLTRLDFVVISHRHGDHTDGLKYLLTLNPRVKVYVPPDEHFGGPTPPAFFHRPVEDLPAHMRYFNGRVPASVPHGSPWNHANTERVEGVVSPRPGIRIVSNISRGPAFTETPELSLIIETPEGRVVVVGCSHPGIETILASIDVGPQPIRLIVGGLHWVMADDQEIGRLAAALKDRWKVASVAPGHCTGEAGFSALQRLYGAHYVYAGLGTAIELR